MRRPQLRYKGGAWRAVFYRTVYDNGRLRYREEWVTLGDPWGNRITDEKASAAAGKALRRLERERSDHLRTPGAEMTLEDAIGAFLAARSPVMAHSSLITYRASLGRAARVIGRLQVGAISSREIEVYQADLLAGGTHPQTVQNYLNILSSVFTWLGDAGIVTENPVKRVRRVRVPDTTRMYLPWADAAPLLACLTHPPYRAAAGLALYAGLRRGETLAARWDHIDEAAGIIHVRNTDSWVSKTGRERDTILMPQLAEILASVPRRGPYVVYHTRSNGVQAKRNALDVAFRRARAEAGMPRLRFHDLRGSFATELLQRFAPAVVQQIMGHTDIQTTMQYYSRIDPQRAVEIVRKAIAP